MISRAAGAVLIFSSAVYLLHTIYLTSGLANQPPGFTGISPLSSSSYRLPLNFFLPHVARMVVGILLIIFSRVAGHWLARGLENANDFQ